jgi:inositol 1,4,5-triphosphate receptor type 1/inositol 1,4,5-triphosphate receptor type 3
MKKIAEQKVFQESVKFFAKNSASIEVLRNGNLERIVFYKLSYCNYLPKESKIEFHENVDRDSVNSKISDLMDKANSLIEVCKHEETLTRFFNKYTFVAIFANYVILWKDLAYLMTLTLNVLIIMSFFSGDTGSDDHMYHERIWGPRFLKYVLSTE